MTSMELIFHNQTHWWFLYYNLITRIFNFACVGPFCQGRFYQRHVSMYFETMNTGYSDFVNNEGHLTCLTEIYFHAIWDFFQDKTYLEACIENHTKSNLFMDQVEFEPAQNWSATILSFDDRPSKQNSLNRW